jgi:hypothetical protein
MRTLNSNQLAEDHIGVGPRTTPWLAGALALMALALSGAAQAQAYVNVTVGGAFAPNVYGQIVIGTNPPPPVVFVHPVVVSSVVVGAPAIYLNVPPGHYQDWGRFCARYNACGRQVYFVQTDSKNRWWEQHNEHLRGREAYREPEVRHDRGNHRSDKGRQGRDEDQPGNRHPGRGNTNH